MRILQLDPKEFDPQGFATRQGIALEAAAAYGARLGTLAARLDGHAAVIFEDWVQGEPAVLEQLLGELIVRLRREFGTRELRAGATAPALYDLYCSRLGFEPWLDLVRYDRPAGLPAPAPRSHAALRPYRDEDGPAVDRLFGEPNGARGLADLATRHQSRFLVAELDGRVLAYALSYVEGPHVLFKSLVVDPELRRSGVGWDLTCDSIRWSESLGLPSHLRTQADNQAARTLYERLGYRLASQTRLVHRLL